MSSQPIRIDSGTLNLLRQRSALTGQPIAQLAHRYIVEAMRIECHPGIIFRDGPAGRRAVVVGGPDVWEVIVAARSAPETGEELIQAIAERTGVGAERVRTAIRYYAEFPGEVNDFIEMQEREADQATPNLVFTTNRQFPRGHPGTAGHLVRALDAFLDVEDGPRAPGDQPTVSVFLQAVD